MNSTDRKRLIPWLLVALLTLALVASLLWILLHDCEDGSGVQGSGDSGSQSSLGDFVIAGSVTRPMTPGVWSSLDLSLTNTGDATILVSELSVSLSGVSAPNANEDHPCTLADFAVHQAADSLDLRLAAGESSSLSTLRLPATSWPRVRMLDRSMNQDGCKESTLTLDYAGTGRREE